MGDAIDRIATKLARVPVEPYLARRRRKIVPVVGHTRDMDLLPEPDVRNRPVPTYRDTPEGRDLAMRDRIREGPEAIEASLNEPPFSDWGTIYGGNRASHMTPEGPVWMFRKGQRVRFLNSGGRQVGPEQSNVAPAVAYAQSQGWSMPPAPEIPARFGPYRQNDGSRERAIAAIHEGRTVEELFPSGSGGFLAPSPAELDLLRAEEARVRRTAPGQTGDITESDVYEEGDEMSAADRASLRARLDAIRRSRMT